MSSEDECVTTLTNCMLMAKLMLGLDVPGVLEEAKRFNELGCFFEPSAWTSKREETKDAMGLLEAALPLWQWAQKKRSELEARDGQGV